MYLIPHVLPVTLLSLAIILGPVVARGLGFGREIDAVFLHVAIQASPLCKPSPADFTFVGFLSGVESNMVPERSGGSKALSAVLAFKRLLPSVGSLMFGQGYLVSEASPTCRTYVLLLSGV